MKVKVLKVRFERSLVNDLTYLKRSIVQHGILFPILVDYDLNVVDGKRRVQACIDLGIEEIEAILVTG